MVTPESSAWVEALIRIPEQYRSGEASIRDLFTEAAPDLSDANAFIVDVVARLRAEPTLIDRWQNYSYDKRSSPSPYLEGCEVGFYDAGSRDVTKHEEAAEACGEFIFREANWVLNRAR